MKIKVRKFDRQAGLINWHDLKNSLTIIKGALDLADFILKKQQIQAKEPMLKIALNNAQTEISTLVKLINQKSAKKNLSR